jgi:hypothetical protein
MNVKVVVSSDRSVQWHLLLFASGDIGRYLISQTFNVCRELVDVLSAQFLLSSKVSDRLRVALLLLSYPLQNGLNSIQSALIPIMPENGILMSGDNLGQFFGVHGA